MPMTQQAAGNEPSVIQSDLHAKSTTVGQPNKPPIVRETSRRAGRLIHEMPMLTNPSQSDEYCERSELSLSEPSPR